MDSFWNGLEISGKTSLRDGAKCQAWTQMAAAIIFMAIRWSSSGPEKQGPAQTEVCSVLTEGL